MKQKNEFSDPFTEQELSLIRELQSAEVNPPSASWSEVNARLSRRSRSGIMLRWAAVFAGVVAISASVLLDHEPQMVMKTDRNDLKQLIEKSVEKVVDPPLSSSVQQEPLKPSVEGNTERSNRKIQTPPETLPGNNLVSAHELVEPVDLKVESIVEENTNSTADPVEATPVETSESQSISYYLPAPPASIEPDRKRSGVSGFVSFVKELKSGDAELGLFRTVRGNLRLVAKSERERNPVE